MTTVVYHRADFDGLFCREIAKKFLGEKDVQYIGWDFGDDPIFVNIPPFGPVYFMDLPIDRPMAFEFDKPETVIGRFGDVHGIKEFNDRLVWIDHHKSSIESHPTDIPGYRIDGVAACRLAWQWFTIADGNAPRTGPEIGIPIRPAGLLPMIQDYKSRDVNEPIAVRLAGEYDIWDHRGDGDLEFQYGLRSANLNTEGWWPKLLDLNDTTWVENLINTGTLIQRYQKQMDERMMGNSFLVEFEGLKFLACNAGGRNSNAFASKDVPETGHDALLAFYYGKSQWMISMYHAKHRKDLDLSQIAVRMGKLSGLGGGGHPGACGFQWPVNKPLPFIMP